MYKKDIISTCLSQLIVAQENNLVIKGSLFLLDAFKIYVLNLVDPEKKDISQEGLLVANWALI